MRFFRLLFINTNFLSNQKNAKKALRLINLGIFLTVFAISSAIITFTIEKKISDKEEELIYLQISSNESGKLISDMESMLNLYEASFNLEEESMIDKEYLSNTKFGSLLISQKDFFSHYIFITIKELEIIFKSSDDLGINFLDPNDPFYNEIYETIEGNWSEDSVKSFKKAILKLSKRYKKIESLNSNDFSEKDIPDYNDLITEIKNSKKNDLLSDNIIGDYHNDLRSFDLATIAWVKELIKYFKGTYYYDLDLIEDVNAEIISLSKKEKNIILYTFIFQFLTFLIIQFFELNSLSLNIKERNAKKI